MKRLFAVLAVVVMVMASTKADAQGRSDEVRHALRYLVGTGMTEGVPGVQGPDSPPALCNWAGLFGIPCPNAAQAPGGDIIKFQGEGVLFLNAVGRPSRHITGGGSFTHLLSSGDVAGTGTWTAKRLLSFEPWGPATAAPLPARFRAGLAHILVDLVSDTGMKFSGTMVVVCRLPGDAGPAGLGEGSYLSIHGGLNFDTMLLGATLFIDLGPQ